jgi:hypothetical protein
MVRAPLAFERLETYLALPLKVLFDCAQETLHVFWCVVGLHRNTDKRLVIP